MEEFSVFCKVRPELYLARLEPYFCKWSVTDCHGARGVRSRGPYFINRVLPTATERAAFVLTGPKFVNRVSPTAGERAASMAPLKHRQFYLGLKLVLFEFKTRCQCESVRSEARGALGA